MYMHYKNCNYFLNKADFLLQKKEPLSIFCAIMTSQGLFLKFIEFVRLCHSQQCYHTRGKLVPVCVCNIV